MSNPETTFAGAAQILERAAHPAWHIRPGGRRDVLLGLLVATAVHATLFSAPLPFLGMGTFCLQSTPAPTKVYVVKQMKFQRPIVPAVAAAPAKCMIPVPDPPPEAVEAYYARAATADSPVGFIGGPARPSPGFPGLSTETYGPIRETGFVVVAEDPLSTFSIDVDTAAYAIVRRYLGRSSLPPAAAVRIEEMVNYFDYGDLTNPGPEPIDIRLEVASCPWQPQHLLARLSVVGLDIPTGMRPAANLVALVDVSGSMQSPDRLQLVKRTLSDLTSRLRADDSVALVVYAGSSGLVLPPTSGGSRRQIDAAIRGLEAGGSTNGGAGIRLAYDLAREHFIEGGVNRVILATDGDFNVGVTDSGELVRLIRERAEAGIFLSVWGVGSGNLKDSRLEQVADQGDGDYAYLDNPAESRRVVDRMVAGGIQNIAKDVKIQVELNPASVESYRLLGYENRALEDHEFRDDTVDAGEMSAGQVVTALYEIVRKTAEAAAGDRPRLRYREPGPLSRVARSDELLHVAVRYKEPEGTRSQLVERVLRGSDVRPMSPDFSAAASVALFGMLLRGSPHAADATTDDAIELARAGLGDRADAERAELVELMEASRRLVAARSRE